MKLRLLIFLLILTNFSFAQNGGYVAIPGTKYALIPPANFVVTSNFGGLGKSIEGDMTKALLSIKYDPKQEEASLEAVSFTIDVTGTGFKLAKYLSGSLIYTVGGEIPSTKPMIIVGSSFGNIPVADRRKYSLERLRKIPGLANAKIDMVKEITIDGLSGYEIIAYSNSKDNKKELSYQVMLFEAAGGYYIIFGQAKEDFQQNLNTFKSIAGTFKEK